MSKEFDKIVVRKVVNMDNLLVVGYGLLFFAIVLPIIIMWTSLVKQGDERRKMMLEKTCTEVFVVNIILLLLNVLADITGLMILKNDTSDIIHLAVIGILFNIRFLFNKKKFGG